jgi:DNA-binding transcriptional ArsR family regulator
LFFFATAGKLRMTPSKSDNPIDPVIHQPTRLRIMSSLAGVDDLDFGELKSQLGLTDGNLSTHLSQLDKAEYVTIDKHFVGRKPRTTVAMTTVGRKAFLTYLAALETLIDAGRQAADGER